MVTRNIKANKPTQVNSDKIGVQVLPSTTFTTITADYKINTVTVTDTFYWESTEQEFGKVFVDIDGNIYFYYDPAIYETEIDGVTYYTAIDTNVEYEYYCTKPVDQLVSGDPIYIMGESGLEQYNQVDYLCELNTTGTQLTDNTVNALGQLYTFYTVENGSSDIFTFIKDSDDKVSGFVRNIEQTSTSTTFNKEDSSSMEGKTEWSSNGVSVWTDSAEPAVGDVVYESSEDPEFNQTTITEVVAEQDEIACQVSYSIKGDSFTTVTPVLTDENNVICNIPKYVYLKFSQDVVITVE